MPSEIRNIAKFVMAILLVSFAAACSDTPLEPDTQGDAECYLVSGMWVCR